MRAPVVLIDGLAQLLEGVVGAEDAHVDVVLEVVAVVDVQAVVEDVERGVVENLLRVRDMVVDGLGLLLGTFPGNGRWNAGLWEQPMVAMLAAHMRIVAHTPEHSFSNKTALFLKLYALYKWMCENIFYHRDRRPLKKLRGSPESWEHPEA